MYQKTINDFFPMCPVVIEGKRVDKWVYPLFFFKMAPKRDQPIMPSNLAKQWKKKKKIKIFGIQLKDESAAVKAP